MSPGSAIDAIRVICEIDVRDILPSVRVPTLVIRHIGDVAAMVPEAQQCMADRMPDARFVELPGTDHFAWREEDGATEEVQEFLAGERSAIETKRVLATILLTDIVRSTDRAAELGDRQWNELLGRHYNMINHTLDQFRGPLRRHNRGQRHRYFLWPARVSALAEPGEVLVSRTVRDLVAGLGLSFAERGSHVLKGVPGERDLFAAA